MTIPTITLNNGVPMPQLGFGVFQVPDFDQAKQAVADALKTGLDYIDLYLLHQPYGDTYGAWKALTEAYQAGKIRAIGVSNFYPDQLKNLELMSSVKPMMNHIEVNPWYQEDGDVAFAQGEDIAVTAWAPFAEGKGDLFNNPLLKEIGERHGKSVGQVVLRWLLQP